IVQLLAFILQLETTSCSFIVSLASYG
ncbi:unnamed protein product, partial [Allacma fusca]